jgi:hypothetical protein
MMGPARAAGLNPRPYYRRSCWSSIPFNCGDRVYAKVDPRHVGAVCAILSDIVRVRFDDGIKCDFKQPSSKGAQTMSEQQIRTELGDVVAMAIVEFAQTARGNWITGVNRSSDTNIQVRTKGGETLSVVVGKFRR